MKRALLRVAGFLIALVLICPLLPVTSKAAGTLADAAIGTVFKIQEDGTYQDWILVDHNYLTTGNQLLMRKDTLYYATEMKMYLCGAFYTDYEYYYGVTDYKNSALHTYLNNTYKQYFSAAMQATLLNVNIPTMNISANGVLDGATRYQTTATTLNTSVFILSPMEIAGKVNTDRTSGVISTGKFIDYFSTDDRRKANTMYVLRDIVGELSGNSSNSGDLSGIDKLGKLVQANVNIRGIGKYFRPCIVLPASAIVGTNNQIDGIITPSTPNVTVSSTWATSNTATLTATNATNYAVTTTNVAPSTGWQTSNVFSLTSNGTYYAWARSATNTVSASKSFTVSRVDTAKPTVNAVTVPNEWATTSTVTISANDAGSGVAAYAVTTGGTSPPVSGWQASNSFTFSANATYYAWAKDQAGNVSLGYEFTIDKIDDIAPVVNKVDMPTDWGTSADITISAEDTGCGITGYAVTTSSTAPAGGWQASNSFNLTANGTYYAWVRDGAGNISARYQFTASKIDTTPPTISYVTVPSTWGASSTITITANDSASGLAAYAVTTTGDPPTTGWGPNKNIEITTNGTYFAWARDAVGNVSARYEFVIEKVDSTKPTVTAVTVPDEWATNSKVTLAASDIGGSGLSAYAVTTTATAPGSGWQSGTNFTLAANGTYYAWARDGAGNISDGYIFTVGKVDTDRPVVDSVTIPSSWGMSSTVTVNGSDATSSIAAYAVTTGGTAAPASGWQISQKFTFSANGTYYAWVKDQAGNVPSTGYEFQITKIDLTAPVISSITMPTDWTATAEITINADDADTGVVAYALTSSSTAPAGGWQPGSSFTITANGTYYAWAKDGVGNTAYKSFTYNKIDTVVPSISSVSVPTSWGASSIVTISATDAASGVTAYAVTTTNVAPSTGWQTGKNVEVTANGKFYAWAKDAVGNVSAGYEFTVSKVDTVKPVITAVTVPDEWAKSFAVAISGTDTGSGISAYAVTKINGAPTDAWQAGSSFNITANGDYYAWIKDAVGNVSVSYKFVVNKIDTEKPVVESVTVPGEWGVSSTVIISASDAGSGVAAYAVTTSGGSAPGTGWQESNRFVLTANGQYFVWVRDTVGNVSTSYPFVVSKVDTNPPIFTDISVPDAWTDKATITLTAIDIETNVAAYALTKSSTPPTSGWQTAPDFVITSNGTWYAWAKDDAGNTAYKSFTFNKIDTVAPSISSVAVPTSWGVTSTVTVSATDAASGVTAYAITSTATAPTGGWQAEKTFEITANGTWYAWARDAVSNVSTAYQFTVSKIDTAAPVIHAVTVPDTWATTSTVLIGATDDAGGVAAYAVTTTSAAPDTGWQGSSSFTLTANGVYYAWAKDAAGNISVSYSFTVSRVDTTKPIVTAVSVPSAWGSESTVTIEADDAESGVVAYAVSSAESAPSSGWQASSSFTIKTNGVWYAWAKDAAGNVSASFKITVDKIDSIAPSILGVVLPEEWTAAAKISVVATDDETGIAGYALTRSISAPADGWQDSPDFTISANGTWYAWVKDQAGNTAYKYFYFNKIDTVAPLISSVSVPTSWGVTSTVTISASDAASGVAAYAVTSTNVIPTDGWQSSKTVTVSGNGTYYAWAKDAVGNVSMGYAFAVDKVDSTAPVVSSVTVSDVWGTSSAVTITAADTGGSGLATYAVTTDGIAPTSGWQAGSSFTLTANGKYYAWAKDAAGNASTGFAFTVTKVDTGKPVVTSVSVPETWGANSTVSILAADTGSGITAYAITKNNLAPSTGWQQSSSFELDANGSYYAWARDAVGNVSAGYAFSVTKVDATKPVISEVSIPAEWAVTAEVTVVASDDETGIVGYALSKSVTVPVTGWQTSPKLTVTDNGSYYAWVKDGAGNTAYRYFTVSKIDTTAPNIGSVAVSSGWGNSGTVTISATDAASGVTAYAVTSSNSAPAEGWQESKTVTVTGNGVWYAWARDAAGNVSAGYEFTVSKVDNTKPIVTAVTVPDEWATSAKVVLTASDEGGSGVTAYAVTATNTTPSSGWQSDSSFTITANGKYYGWAKDAAGNVSAGYEFLVSKIDTTKPVVASVSVPAEWGPGSTVTVEASDAGSGVVAYAVTKNGTAPTYGWQPDSNFTLDSNATYYAWARDACGNVSAGYEFTVSKVDAKKPVIGEITVSTEWGTSVQVSIAATDDETGIAGYALTKSSTAPATGWQASPDFTVTENGTWYAWVKDQAGNTASKSCNVTKVDTTAPTVTYASVSTGWGTSNTVTISATDAASGVVAYAVTSSNIVPSGGWQDSKTITVTGNGTWYAWAQDACGNVSAGYKFTVSKVDVTKPVISAVSVPTAWSTSAKVAVTASDGDGSGLTAYAVTNTDAVPTTGWQSGSSFTLTANGQYYAWAKDAAGNISAVYAFTVSKVDVDKPVVNSVTIPADWAMSGTVTIAASDTGSGIAAYAVTTGGSSPPVSGWQESNSFTFSANGTYFAWVRDAVGNVSAAGFEFALGKIDRTKPTIAEVVMPESWTATAQITIMATDAETGIAAYAVTANSTAPAADAWQASSSFTLAANGTYYAWARDGAGNTAYQYIYFNKLDAGTPVITDIRFNNANTVVSVSATDAVSGVKGIYIGDTAFSGGYIQYQIPDGTRYLTIYAEDNAGNKSDVQTVRVPGWFDVMETLTIETVSFDPDVKTATITAATTGSEIAGVYVNNKLCAGNPAVFTINGAQYLDMQAVDVNGDRSAVYQLRVPGWAEEVRSLAITECEFSFDNLTAVITATETAAEGTQLRGITGIEINGEFFSGNPVAYSIPERTRHLEMRAYNTDGDYSPLLIRRVPGWSEIVSTISISNIEFTDYNTRATVTALATGGDSVAGIFINEEYFAGNPVVYKIDKDVDTLHVQAVNPNGDLSAMVNKAVPKSTVKSTLKLEIEAPDWTGASRAKVKITAGDSIGLKAIMAKTGEDDDWTDVTSSRYIWIDDDTTVYASVENADGTVKETSLDIICFDRAAPTVSAAQQDKIVNIRAEDKKSGVKAIYVNNVEHSGSKIYGGNLAYTIPEGITTVTIKAVDNAGNASDTLELPVRTTLTAVPGIIAPSQPAPVTPEPDPEPAAIPDPEPEPEPEPIPEPQIEEEPEEDPKAAGMTQGQMAGLAAGAFGLSSAGTAGTLWWLRRRRLMSEAVPDFDPNYRKVYDESEFKGTKDPMDQRNVTEVDFNRKVS